MESNNYSGNSSIRADGQYITFGSYASNLVPNDTNDKEDIFVARNPLLSPLINAKKVVTIGDDLNSVEFPSCEDLLLQETIYYNYGTPAYVVNYRGTSSTDYSGFHLGTIYAESVCGTLFGEPWQESGWFDDLTAHYSLLSPSAGEVYYIKFGGNSNLPIELHWYNDFWFALQYNGDGQWSIYDQAVFKNTPSPNQPPVITGLSAFRSP